MSTQWGFTSPTRLRRLQGGGEQGLCEDLPAPARIALVAPFGLRAKGTARARALPLGQALAGRGHEVALFIPPYDSPADSGLCWRAGDVTLYNVPLPGALRAPSGPLRTALAQVELARRLLAAVRAWRPDVVHVFKPKGPSGLVATGFWMAGRLPWAGPSSALVVDSDDWEGAGGWNDDPRPAYSALQRRVFAWQERFGLAHAAAWTVTSRCLAGRAAACGADPMRIFVLPNGLADPALWFHGQPAEHSRAAGRLQAQPSTPTALLYTRFAGVRVADVAAVWRRVLASCPAARLMVVGRGLGGEEAALAGAAPNVDLAGWVEPAEMPALFARIDVALLPWADTPANQARHSAKVLDLMAAGLPAVAYAVGELPVTLGEGGVIVPPGDESAFAAAVVVLLNDPARRRQLGAAARARVASAYTWDRLAGAALAAYHRAMGVDGAC